MLKIRAIPAEVKINTENIFKFHGICGPSSDTLGTIKLKLAGYVTEFLIIPNDVSLRNDGILGTQFFSQTLSRINFQTQELEIDGNKIPMKRKALSEAPKQAEILNVESRGINGRLPMVTIHNTFKEFDVRFLIDTGSESNLLRRWMVPSRIHMNIEKKQFLKGIGHKLIPTLGITDLIIFGIKSEFQVIPDDIQAIATIVSMLSS